MGWPIAQMLAGLVSHWKSAKSDPQRIAHRVEDIRLTMLDMLGEEGARRFPHLAERIQADADAQGLWYARTALMAALADLYGEQVARTRMISLSALFDGMLPKGMTSHIAVTTLRL